MDRSYIKGRDMHLRRYGRIVLGVFPFESGRLWNLVTGISWCGVWRGIGCEAEKIAIEFDEAD